jgi:hypothetical protein
MYVSKHKLDSFYLTLPFEQHSVLKEKILSAMETTASDTLQNKDAYYNDNIQKLDWSKSDDTTRPWVQLLMPDLQTTFNKVANSIGYQQCLIKDLWFQQYVTGNTHGWHTHGHNFTGVYYLEFSKNSPVTELINPFTQADLLIPDVAEGDIIIFPSFTIHRAPVITNDIRKTIISFNLEFDGILTTLLDQINLKASPQQ